MRRMGGSTDGRTVQATHEGWTLAARVLEATRRARGGPCYPDLEPLPVLRAGEPRDHPEGSSRKCTGMLMGVRNPGLPHRMFQTTKHLRELGVPWDYIVDET